MRLGVWLGLGVVLGAAPQKPLVREELRVSVNGVVERWRLEWRSPPELACFETEGVTCPCEGFAQGEQGELDLVRQRPGAPEERVALTPLFADDGGGDAPVRAVLRGWEVSARDGALTEEERPRALRRRKRVRAMVLGDYDHDGQAREFVLQTQASGCGLRDAVLLGVDRRDGHLRALGTVEHPDRPLVLEPETWAKLRGAARVDSVETPCGDHGSESESVVRVHADAAGLHATRAFYTCTPEGQRGASASSEVL